MDRRASRRNARRYLNKREIHSRVYVYVAREKRIVRLRRELISESRFSGETASILMQISLLSDRVVPFVRVVTSNDTFAFLARFFLFFERNRRQVPKIPKTRGQVFPLPLEENGDGRYTRACIPIALECTLTRLA